MDKIYTVDDWKNGSMHKDLLNRDLPEEVLSGVKNVGYLSQSLFRNELLSEEDHNEILRIMEDTFFKVLDHNAEQHLAFFVQNLDDAYKPDELIEERIKELQRKFDKADHYFREGALKGSWDRIGIDYKVYQKINDENYKMGFASLIQFTPSKNYDRLGGFYQLPDDRYYSSQNIMFDVSEVYRFKERLIKFKSEKKSPKKAFSDLTRNQVTKKTILLEAHRLKDEGYKIDAIFSTIKNQLFNAHGFTNVELESKFGFSMTSSDSFRKLMNRNLPYSFKD